VGKKAKTAKTQKVKTTTTTTLRDIGLTGAQAVDLASVLESGAIARTQINADLMEGILQTMGSGYQPLAGGTGAITQTAGKAGVIQETEALKFKDFEKVMPFIALALVGTIYLTRKS